MRLSKIGWTLWLSVAVQWVFVVTDSSSLPRESGCHDSQHTDSPQGPHVFGPRPQGKCSPHSGLPDHRVEPAAGTPSAPVHLLSLTEPDTLFTPQGSPLHFQEGIYSLPFLKTGTPLGLSFVFLFLKNILFP